MSRPLRAALINATEAVGHHGCTLVCRQIAQLAIGAGIEVRPWLPLDTATAEMDGSALDLVIVNGEGVLHHDRPSVDQIAAHGRILSARRLPAYLINSVYQDIKPAIAADLSAYRRIFVRDGASAAEATAAHLSVEIVPDLTLSWLPVRISSGGTRVVVTDSILGADRRTLYRLSRRLGASYVPLITRPPEMPDFPDRNRQRQQNFDRQRWTALLNPLGAQRAARRNTLPTFEAFTDMLANEAALLVTGRFHGLCIALDLEIPVLAMRSNTHKVEGLCTDAGIPHRIVEDLDAIEEKLRDSGPTAFAYSKQELADIRAFRRSTRSKAEAMFRAIAADADAPLRPGADPSD